MTAVNKGKNPIKKVLWLAYLVFLQKYLKLTYAKISEKNLKFSEKPWHCH